MNARFQKVLKWLGSRLARNIYLWAIMLYFVLDLNSNNEAYYHHGITTSSWYAPVMIVSTLLQMTLLYVNNLVLVPKLLARKKYLPYFLLAFLLLATVSVTYTIGLKVAKAHVNVDHLQQIGFVSSPVTTDWSAKSLRAETETYLFGNAMWIFIFTMAWFMNDYARQRKLAEDARREQIDTQLTLLKNQLNPHFLFNTLNNLYALTLKKADEAPDAILKLSAIMRYMLYESDTPFVPLEKEKEIMQAYIDLELLRLRNRENLAFHIHADGAGSIPPLLWLPVLENVFKHGTRIISEDNFVEYYFTIEGERLHILSRNSTKETPGPASANGIGLQNLQKRLALLFPSKHTLQSYRDHHQYITDINIDLS